MNKCIKRDFVAYVNELEKANAKAHEEKQQLEAELRKQKDAADGFLKTINSLNMEIEDSKEAIENLNNSLAEKEWELEDLACRCNQGNIIKSFVAERKEVRGNVRCHGKCDDAKPASYGKQLSSKGTDLNDFFKEMPKKELRCTKEPEDLKKELRSTQEALQASRLETDNLVKQIQDLKKTLQDFKEQLENASAEASFKESLIDVLSRDRDNLKNALKKEAEDSQGLWRELQNAQERSKKDASDLMARLNQIKNCCDARVSAMEKQLEFSSNETRRQQSVIAELTVGRNMMMVLYAMEAKDAKDSRSELEKSQRCLETSRNHVANLAQQLDRSEAKCEELTLQLSTIRNAYADAQKSLEEAKRDLKKSSDDVYSAHNELCVCKRKLEEVNNLYKKEILKNEQSESKRREKCSSRSTGRKGCLPI